MPNNKFALVFKFWLSQLGKLFELTKSIYIFDNISLFHSMVAFVIITILLKLIRFGVEKTSIYDPDTDSYREVTQHVTTFSGKNFSVKHTNPKKFRIYHK